MNPRRKLLDDFLSVFFGLAMLLMWVAMIAILLLGLVLIVSLLLKGIPWIWSL